jgi:DNA-binding response OmpR family regulator
VLDLVMPKVDGMTMLKNLRKDSWGHSVPVIILTNLSGAKEASEAFENLAYDFLVKNENDIEDVIAIAKEKLGITKKRKS